MNNVEEWDENPLSKDEFEELMKTPVAEKGFTFSSNIIYKMGNFNLVKFIERYPMDGNHYMDNW